MWKILHETPIVYRSLLCRFGLHPWWSLTVDSGMAKRMVTGRRGCPRCGRIELRTSGISPPHWWRWGYCDPVDLDMSLEAFRKKYIVRADVPAT